jgi:hypothetical protein
VKNYSIVSGDLLEEEWQIGDRTYRLSAILHNHNAEADEQTMFLVFRWRLAQRERLRRHLDRQEVAVGTN